MRKRLWIAAVAIALVAHALAGPLAAQPSAPPPGSAPPVPQWDLEWARGAVFYEIFVRSFADSNGDGIGDLAGLLGRLDYLNDGDPATTTDLGVTGLWLMPVFASPSYHGYDATDYEKIDPDYGTDADLDRLLAEAHRRGMRVILDLMLNHTSAEHPWFVESASSPASAKRDWYVWRPDDPGWTQPWADGPTWHEKNGAYFYGLFWSGMPDLNFDNPAVRSEMARIAERWLARGVDGFRLDAARHITADGPGEAQNDTPRTHAFWRDFAARIRERHPRALLVGENWSKSETIATYYGSTAVVKAGDELPMSFDFPLGEAILEGLDAGDAAGIAETLERVAASYPPGALDGTFLTNHDMTRLATRLGGDPGKLRAAAATLLTLPGTPFLYYGEEVGIANGPGRDDRFKRTPMPWGGSANGGFSTAKPWFDFAPERATANVAAETGDAGSLLSHYRRLIHLRNTSPALARGSLSLLAASGAGSPVLAFLRETPDERVLVIQNLGPRPAPAGALGVLAGVGASSFESMLTTDGVPVPSAVDGGGVKIEMPPYATGVWRLRR